MYRPQQGVPPPANASSVHPWYTGYHPQPIPANEPQIWEQQVWHPHIPHAHAHAFFPGNDLSEYMAQAPVMENNHNQVMHSPPTPVSGSELSSPGGPSENISPPNAVQHVRPGHVRSPYEWIKRASYQNQPNPGKFHLLCLHFVPISKYIIKLQ